MRSSVWLVVKQLVPDNPALFVKGPKFSRKGGESRGSADRRRPAVRASQPASLAFQLACEQGEG